MNTTANDWPWNRLKYSRHIETILKISARYIGEGPVYSSRLTKLFQFSERRKVLGQTDSKAMPDVTIVN